MRARLVLLVPCVWGMAAVVGCGAAVAIDSENGGAGGTATTPSGTTSATTTSSTSLTTSSTTSSTSSSTSSTTSSSTTSSSTTSSSTTSTTATLVDPGLRLGHGNKPSCLKHADGTAVCVEVTEQNKPEIVPVPGITDAVAVERSGEFGCVLRAAGEVSCWGWSHKGQLGLAVPEGETSDAPVTLPGVTLTKISAGHHSVCGIEPSGQAVCWGGSYSGPLGDPSLAESQSPVSVIGISDAIDVANSFDQACAVRANGEVHCWRTSEAPHVIAGVVGASRVAMDRWKACAIVGAGDVVCWDQADEIVTPIPEIEDAVQVVINGKACVRRASGEVTCWDEWMGGGAAKLYASPIHDAVDIGAASPVASDFCAVQSTGAVSCWMIGPLLQSLPYPG